MYLRKVVAILVGVLLLAAPAARANETLGALEFERGRRHYEGLALDYPKAAEHFERAAQAGNVYARYMLGVLAKQGAGVPRDVKAARTQFLAVIGPLSDLARQGEVLAQRYLGLMHQEGDGTTHSLELARAYFSSAAAQGDATSQLQLARYYAQGMGVKVDNEAARKWYTQAAAQGVAEAQYELATLLLAGEPEPDAQDVALRWLAAAAKQNFPGSLVHPPRLRAKVVLEDSDGDGVLSPGEEGRAWIFVRNHGGLARDVRIFLEPPEHLMLPEAGRGLPLGDLTPGEWADVAVSMRLAKNYKGPAAIHLQAVITEARAEYETALRLVVQGGVAP